MKESGSLPGPGGLPLNSLRGEASAANQRREERFLAERSVHIVYQGQPATAWLVDCSEYGLQIVTRQSMAAHDEFQVEVRMDGKFRLVRYQVRYWSQLWDDTCQIGAQMIEEIPEAEAKLILQEMLAAAER